MLLLTKPLGVGILLSAYKMQALDKIAYKAMITSMTTLNRYASEIMKKNIKFMLVVMLQDLVF